MPEFNIGDEVVIVSDDGDAIDFNNHLAIGTIGVVTEFIANQEQSYQLDVCVYFASPLDGSEPFDWWVNHSALSFVGEDVLRDRLSRKIHRMFIRQPYYAKYIGE